MEPGLSWCVRKSVWPALKTIPSYILNSSSTKSHVPLVELFVPSPSLRIQFPSMFSIVHWRRLSWLSSNLILQLGMRPIKIFSSALNVNTWSSLGPSMNLSWILSLVLLLFWSISPFVPRLLVSPWKKLTVKWDVPNEIMNPFLRARGTSKRTNVPDPLPRSLM